MSDVENDDDGPEVMGGGLDGLGAALGGLDLGSLLGGAQQMFDAQARAGSEEVTGSSGGGTVRIVVTGGGEFRSVHLAPEVVDPGDVGMLEDLVLAALRDAMGQVQQLQAGAMGGFDLGGLGGLGGLLGGQG